MTTRAAQPGEPGALADLFTDIGRLLGAIAWPDPPSDPATLQSHPKTMTAGPCPGRGSPNCFPDREP